MDISCPVSAARVNESVVRVVAFVVAVIGVSCLIFANYWAMLFLAVDFGIRAFTPGKWSPLRFIALGIAKMAALPIRMTDLAPKKFAATMGFVFCILIFGVGFFNIPFIPAALNLVLIAFALLESLFAVCIGCYLYSLIQHFKRKN